MHSAQAEEGINSPNPVHFLPYPPNRGGARSVSCKAAASHLGSLFPPRQI